MEVLVYLYCLFVLSIIYLIYIYIHLKVHHIHITMFNYSSFRFNNSESIVYIVYESIGIHSVLELEKGNTLELLRSERSLQLCNSYNVNNN